MLELGQGWLVGWWVSGDRMLSWPDGVWFQVCAGCRCDGERSVEVSDAGLLEGGLWLEMGGDDSCRRSWDA